MKALYREALGTPQIAGFANSLADLGDRHAPDLKVETCGTWSIADLLWHLTEVQSFWAYIIANRPSGPESYQQPDRPADSALPDALRAAAAQLSVALDAADESDSAWSWSDDHTVGFSVRRQTHEALIHYIDGILAAKQPIPQIAKKLAADGVDEMVHLMIADLPSWASFVPANDVVRLKAHDTGDAWAMRLGRLTGTPPGSDEATDVPAAIPEADLGDQPGCTLTASAQDLCFWLWGRANDSAVTAVGDTTLSSRLRDIIATNTQ